jgi:hypothetical protein
VELKTLRGDTNLMYTASFGHPALTKLLVQKGADVNAQASDGMSALMWACKKGHAAPAELLMRNRAKTHFTDGEGRTAFDLLDDEGNTLSDAEKDRLRALPMLIKKEWWSVRGDLDLFRYQAGFVSVPEVDRSSAAVTAMWTDYKTQRDEIDIHRARIKNLESENDRLRRELEVMKNEIRSGRTPVIAHKDEDTATATHTNETEAERKAGEKRKTILAERKGTAEAMQQEGGARMRLNEDEEEEEEEDVFKKLFSNDRLVKYIMRHLR